MSSSEFEDDAEYGLFTSEPAIGDPDCRWIGDESGMFVKIKLTPDFEEEDVERANRIAAALTLCYGISDEALFEAAARKIRINLPAVASDSAIPSTSARPQVAG